MVLIDINLASEANGVDLARSLISRWGVATVLMSGDIIALAAIGNLSHAVVLKSSRGRSCWMSSPT